MLIRKLSSLVLGITIMISNMGYTIYAEGKDDQLIQDDIITLELSNAIVSGDGTEANPYVVDYSNAPTFQEYIENNWEAKSHPGNNGEYQVNGTWTSSILTQYQGLYANGGIWVYSSGGYNVYSDGNIRVKKVAYTPNGRLAAIYAAKTTNNAWLSIVNNIGDNVTTNYDTTKNTIQAILINAGYATIGAYSAITIAGGIALSIGAAGGVAATLSLLNAISTAQLSAAMNANKNYVTVDFLTAYQGSWYSYQTSEAGWTNSYIYIPSSSYGSGYFYPIYTA